MNYIRNEIIKNLISVYTEKSLGLYICFKTRHKGVVISSKLLKQYPDEITIVLEHQFDKLVLQEAKFSINLSFGGVAETISVPYDSIFLVYSADRSLQLSLHPTEIESSNLQENSDKKTKPSSEKDDLTFLIHTQLNSNTSLKEELELVNVTSDKKKSNKKSKGEVLIFPSDS